MALPGRASSWLPKGKRRIFLRSLSTVARKILLQSCAILPHTVRTGLNIFPYEKHAMRRNENPRNSLGSNYKSAALDQLGYAGQSMSRETPCAGAMSC